MKKFYLLTAGMTVALSSAAFNLSTSSVNFHKGNIATENKKIEKVLIGDSQEIQRVIVATRADESTSIEGLWIFQLGDYYFQDSTNGPIAVAFEAALESEDFVIFESVEGISLPFLASYDATTGNLTFTKEELGVLDGYYVYQQPFVYNWNTQNLDNQDISGTYDAKLGIISFQQDAGISWPAYQTPTAPTNSGYYGIYDLLAANRPEEDAPDDSNEWISIGNATFMDGWVLPAFGLNQEDNKNKYEVPMERNKNNLNLYRLVDPYHLGPVAMLNYSTTIGHIVIDITDPDHVVFLQSNAGFSYPGAGITSFYCYNRLGCKLAENPGKTVQELIAELGDEIPYTTLKDGVVNLNSINTPEGTMYDANFGIQSNPTGGMIWRDAQTNAATNMTSSIKFPEDFDGVETIGVDNVDTVVYYNLQGMKVSNPEKGQLLIIKSGKTTKKVVY